MENKTRSLALILDGEVLAIVNFDEPTAYILMSNPEIIDITDKSITSGWKFDGSSFSTNIDGKEVKIGDQQ